MQSIYVNIPTIRSHTGMLTSSITKLSSVLSGVSQVSGQIDWRIKSRNGIGTRLSSIRSDLNKVQNDLTRLDSFMQNAMTNYANAENKVVRRADELSQNWMRMFNISSHLPMHYQSNYQYGSPALDTWYGQNPIYNNSTYSQLTGNPRIGANGVAVADTGNESNISWDPTPSIGFNYDQWREQPINAAASFGAFAATSYGAARRMNLARQGFGVTKSYYTTAQGKTKVRVHVSRPELGGFNKKTYSGANATNYTKLYKHVDAATNIKQSFKWAGNRLGYIGIGTTVVGDIVHGVQNNQSASEIAGNVTGDVAVAGASIAASAYAGAKVGAIAGTFLGGPVGTAVGAAVGAAGIVVTSLLSDLKFMDVDNDGKKDSIGDAIKKGTKGLIDKIGSWFD